MKRKVFVRSLDGEERRKASKRFLSGIVYVVEGPEQTFDAIKIKEVTQRD